tara:strand:- start:3020 stop:4597 length:1578 start_codon:yes stop_codon:yes gene_type:complete
MKKIIISILALYSFNSNAESAQDLLNSNVSVVPNSISVPNSSSYKADKVTSYEGRNENRSSENLTSQVKSGTSVSRTVHSNSNVRNTQLENLESTAGELVQKVEDDRIKKSKKYEDKLKSNKATLQDVYDITATVDINNLGSEQDPDIQNAFKCLDIKKCNEDPSRAKTDKDARAISRTCASDERLHWNGNRWECVGIFAKISPSKCGSKQYAKTVNGGTACIDYVYEWGQSGYTSCNSDGEKTSIVKCFQKKELGDKNEKVVSDANCLVAKPSSKSEQCSSSWTVGSWGACSKTCGGGTQTRSVTCSSGYRCTGVKPATSQACNTTACVAGCSAYTKSITYCSKNHGTVKSSKSSYVSGDSEIVGIVSKVNTKYEVEYTIKCEDGKWKESGSQVPFNYQTGEKYKCGSSAPKYTCSVYGSGWTLSGTTCTKTSNVCKYDSKNKVNYYKYGSYNCLGPSHDRKYSYVYNGKSLGRPTSSTSYNGYTVGKKVASHTCGGGSSGPSGILTYYEICTDITETKPAVKQ